MDKRGVNRNQDGGNFSRNNSSVFSEILFIFIAFFG